MKKLLLILLCLPMIFSCGDEKEDTTAKKDIKNILNIEYEYDTVIRKDYPSYKDGYRGPTIPITDTIIRRRIKK